MDQGKLGHIQVTKGINLDECILEGDRASNADLIAPTPSAAVLKRFVDNAGLRSVLQALPHDAPSGLFQFRYRLSTTAATTSAPKHIAMDKVGTTAGEIYKTTTVLYVNSKDAKNNDMTLFLDGIDAGDYFNIHDNGDINDYVAFDVTGKPTKTGDVYAIPVSWYAEGGKFTDNEIVNVHWKQPVANPFESTYYPCYK